MASTGEVWRLGRRPALDGLRGIAVLMVLTTHLRIPGFALAPAVGVVVFFALSGFLITSLLLERDESLGRFYLRRAARLVPALMVCVTLYIGLQFALTGRVYDWAMIAAGVTYTLNWWMIAVGYDPNSGIAHLWSLAVEEQFYLAWPLLLVALRRFPRRWMLAATLALAGLSLLIRFDLRLAVGYSRAYHGFDARADALLIGCVLALFMHGRRERRAPPWLAAPLTVAVFAWSYTGTSLLAEIVMPAVVAALTAGVLCVAVNGGGPEWLSRPLLAWVGRRSYGLYLYHFPIRWAVERYDDRWWVTAPVVLATSLALAELSWRHVENPVLGVLRLRAQDGAMWADRGGGLDGEELGAVEAVVGVSARVVHNLPSASHDNVSRTDVRIHRHEQVGGGAVADWQDEDV